MGTRSGSAPTTLGTPTSPNYSNHFSSPQLRKPASDVRIINLTSDSHKRALVEEIQFENRRTADKPATAMARYGQSSLPKIYSKALERRYPSLTAVAVHPGVVKTDLQATMRKSRLLAKVLGPVFTYFAGVEVEEGAHNQLWAATSKGVETGKLYYPVGPKVKRNLLAGDMELARKLWEWTEKELSDDKYRP